MVSTVDITGDRLRRTVARIHAACLVAITITAVVSASVGWQGSGPFRILAAQPWGYIGLYQAYLLMLLIAVIAWVGANRWPGGAWNALLLGAELVPLSIIVIAADVFGATGEQAKAYIGLALHITFVALETFALLWRPSSLRQAR
jgi:hypothetical protein